MNKIILRREKQVSTNNTGMTREQLRQFAKATGVKRGRNTSDTIKNLKDAGFAATGGKISEGDFLLYFS